MKISLLMIRDVLPLLLLLAEQNSVEGSSIGGNITVNTNLTLHGSPYVVSRDIVVHENATLTLQPGVELHFYLGVSLHVKGSLQATGTSDREIVFRKIPSNISVNEDDVKVTYNDGIRLSGGPNYRTGRLEIFLNERWGTVCDDGWDIRDTQVACRQLGFLKAKRYYTHGGGTGPIWLDDLGCQGRETSLLECSHRGIGSHNCGHGEDIGIECYYPMEFLANKVYWKGVMFSSPSKPQPLQYVRISDAYEAIKGGEFLPSLYHVTVNNSVFGIVSEGNTSPLTIDHCDIRDNQLAGICIKSGLAATSIVNTAVDNTAYGDGLSYSGMVHRPVDFCSANANDVTFPIAFQASGNTSTKVDCAKVIKTQPGGHLTVYYHSMVGEKFELKVHDGNTTNATVAAILDQLTVVNQAVTPTFSTGHELYIRFRYNGRNGATVKFVITDDKEFSSLLISNCTINDHNGRGVTLKDITGKVFISKTAVCRNKRDGLSAERILGRLTITETNFIDNLGEGLKIQNSSLLLCNLRQLSAKRNSRNGVQLMRIAHKSNVSDLMLEANWKNGLGISDGTGSVDFRNVTTVLNRLSGVRISDGKTSSTFSFCNFSRNREDGCFISNQAGDHQLFNCTANSNSRYGVNLLDVRTYNNDPSRHQFRHLSLVSNDINNNGQYGVRVGPYCRYWKESAVNVTMSIFNNNIECNGGGIILSPGYYCYWYWNLRNTRKVSAIVSKNVFKENRVNTFNVNCMGRLGLEAVIESNKFIYNTDKVLTLVDNYQCGRNKQTRVNLKIWKNIFQRNRVAQNVLHIDLSAFPKTRSATVINNTFEENVATTQNNFQTFYQRTTLHAVIVLKEGSFMLRENVFENPGFTFQISTLRHDHQRAIDAKFNWWGTTDECEIIDTIFDFSHRVQLSPVHFFPYFTSYNRSRVINSNISRPSCFLRNRTIGGILDKSLVLSSEVLTYEVRDDIIVFTNGTLIIPKNTTLQFPPRSAMVVQGTLVVNGTENEKVRFMKKSFQGKFRLAGESEPSEGRVEFLVNGTWLPMCLRHGRSFVTEGQIICQQLSLKYQLYRTRSLPVNKTVFVHNVVCDSNVNTDIMNCNYDAWGYGSECQGHTVYVYCERQNWVGLHLPMSNHRSTLHHLEIYDAGMAYRSDINIPGASLRIDFNHHDISNVLINNSDGIGVQVVYQSLFHNLPWLENSTVTDTESHGIHSLSPLSLTDVNMTRNRGYGFYFENVWNKINTFAADTASPDVNQIFYICSSNKTFVQASKIFHFTLEALNDNQQFTCQHVMETEPGYKLVIQVLYFQKYYHNDFMHVYDGLNMSVGSPWKMGAFPWRDRPVFNSTRSSVFFHFKKRRHYTINFLVYTIKESKRVDYSGGQISIKRVTIFNSIQGGIFIDEDGLKSLSIAHSTISNSRQFGIRIRGRWWASGISSPEIFVKNCLIQGSGTHGIYISSSRIKVVKIVNSTVTKNGYRSRPWGHKCHGICLYLYSSAKFLLENSEINETWKKGVYIYSSYRDNVIRIINSSIARSGDCGLTLSRFAGIFFAGGNTFAWNKKGAVSLFSRYCNNYCQSEILLYSNSFFHNGGPTVEVSTYNYYRHKPNVIVSRNIFTGNNCTNTGVIDIRGTAVVFVLKENDFLSNIGRCVLLEGTATVDLISITDNVFTKNDCEGKSVIEAQRIEKNSKFSNNTFVENMADSVVLIQVIHSITPSLQNAEFVISNNTLFDNSAHNSSRRSTDKDFCAVIISGILYYKDVIFHYNKFNNSKYPRELCIRVSSISQHDVVNVTLNWWGTVIASAVRDRISDFDDNYDFAIANDWPFLLSSDDPTLISPTEHDFKHRGHVLSGRLFESITLRASQSPYYVTADLTILENVSLSIEPGVTVEISPRVSILVAGELQARGTLAKPIHFTVREATKTDEPHSVQVRLVGGDFPWEGLAEVFYNKSWKTITTADYLSTSTARVIICKQLGYGPPASSSEHLKKIGQNLNESFLVALYCHGNETFLNECSINNSEFNSSNCSLVVKCEVGEWGNVRFISSRDVNVSQETSTLEHVQFSLCGNRHGMSVPAIEAVINVPEMRFITVRNCIGGGLRVHFPRNDVYINSSRFIKTGDTGINFLQTKRNIVVENSESSENQRGISFEESSKENVPRVHYGQIFLCGKEKAVLAKNHTLLYFEISLMVKIPATGTCQKVLRVTRGQGIKMTLLYVKGTQRLRVYDSVLGYNVIVDKSNAHLTNLVHKELFIPRDAITVRWTGNVNSQMVIQVEEINIVDTPCTFEQGFCGWNTFANISVNGFNVTTTWQIRKHYYSWWWYIREDYSYFSNNGRRLHVTNNPYQLDARAVLISPPITKFSQLCSLVFFYRLQRKGRAALSLYIQRDTTIRTEQRLIWRAKNVELWVWKKVVITLPSDIDEYRLLLEGECNKSSRYYSRNHVMVDNLELLACSNRAHHRVFNSVFSGNFHQAINYTSVADGSHRRPPLSINRCHVTDIDASHSNATEKGAISLDIQDNNFTLANNFIKGNYFGAIDASLSGNEGTIASMGLIYGNTISKNANGTIAVKQRRRLENSHSFVNIVENTFENNLGYGSTVNISDVHSEIVNNFFYNNSGLHSIEYSFTSTSLIKQMCELNTFYLNRGIGQNYGVTILSNGPMEYHRNNFKNPSNLYELSSTRQAVSDPIHADMNWWGVGMESEVGSRIFEKGDDYRLATVEYKPFQRLPPRDMLSIGCPATWLSVDSTCMVFRSGGRTFKEATSYCQYFGGHVASTNIPADMIYITSRLRAVRPDGKPTVPLWVWTDIIEDSDREQQCTVITQNETQKLVPCNSFYPFLCTRNAVIRCPNSCFHNGDCVGATCFCRRGWTGLDCSQFDCNDVHNCSGNGKCVGPNVCKCKPGFAGRGCSFSYCTKFRRCSTCSQGDPACGWCDSLQQCMPGTSKGPYTGHCPDWFYFTCYTVGNASHCSNKIQRVDCGNRQCNLTKETSNKESCQKCHDLEKCYNYVEKGECRAWNDTRCPNGLVKVDYTDQNRIENTLLRSNVKIIDPNTTIIYSCPVTLPGDDGTATVFVAPRSLGIKAGDVLSSPQAGGVMHKVNETTTTGPYVMILGSLARIEEVIQYADFTQRVSPVNLVDESTVDDEPSLDDLNGLLDGNITLNNSNLHVLSSEIPVFKCVGHIYKVDDELVFSQFLVISKEHELAVKTEDVIVSAQSHGFIERVTKVYNASGLVFLETELERCTENTTWTKKFKGRLPGSSSDNDVVCIGGDNSYGLMITELEGELSANMSVNDSVIGRSSYPFITKVIESHESEVYVLIEVLPVQSIVNGTAVTAVTLDQLHKEHRRQKRDINKNTIKFRKTHQKERKITLFGTGYVAVKQTFKVFADFIVSVGVFTYRDQNGKLVITDTLFGLEMVGEVIYNVDVEIGIGKSSSILSFPTPVVPPVQIGPGFCIPVAGVCIPCAFFFEAEIVQSMQVSRKVFAKISFTSSAQIGLGGFCTFTGGCQKIKPHFEVNRGLNIGRVTAEKGFTADSQLIPKLTFRFPSKPKVLRRLVNKLNKFWKKAFKFLGYRPGRSSGYRDWSILRLSVEVPYGLKATITPCSSNCVKDLKKPNEFKLSYGFSEIVGKLSVGFGKKNYEILALSRTIFSASVGKSVCFSCGTTEPCCPTTPPPTTKSTTAVTTKQTTKELSTTEKTTEMTTTEHPTSQFTTERTTGSSTTEQSTTQSTTEMTTGSTTTEQSTPQSTTEVTTGSTTAERTTTQSTTPPPTTPPPCECANGNKGTIGPDGNCRCPPKCKNGRKPVFVNKRYKCPDHPPCGENPNCVVGRKGPGCSQPDVPGCPSGCSGNGVAVALPDCRSRCVCSVRWTGTCCERRRPWRNWGDPHLETLDGIEFDYFGIGEFWGCKSLFNDFGLQFRYFAYQRASLTGGVAIKVGQSMLSIMSLNRTNAGKFPKLRINGALVNITSHIGRKMTLDNGSAIMDIQKTFSNKSDETGIMLVSLQFESGLTVTVDVRHSHAMDRQYLNVLFTPTIAFKGHTEGLCGVMDNDPSNDLRGPNGEHYNDPIQFADSWRITAVQTNFSQEIWSWNSSNFHGDDVMDSSYNDPNYIPLYSLAGIDDTIVAKATAACSLLGLSHAMLRSCIYDVAVTNDSSFTAQETLQQDCPDQCSGKGRCVNSTCQCMIGWSGDNCQLGDCANCSAEHGTCLKGFCECDDGWEGVTCKQKATCYNVNNCTSSRNGVCKRTDQCRCLDGYIGLDCSIIPTCFNVSNCSSHGICIDYDVCKCEKEWTGKDCTQFSCASLDYCSGQGHCVAPYKCDCNPGWTGDSCAVPDCAGANECSGQGECVSSNTCECFPGFQGMNCSDVADCSLLGNCSGNGVCVQDKQSANLTCRCYAGFSGANCSIASCLSVNNCSGHGRCVEANFCKCETGYTGADCANASCEALNYCSGHGVCVGFDTCACDSLWHGPACSEANCSRLNDCSNKGVCILPNTCECYPGYDGVACNATAKPNLHAPVFFVPLYNLSLSENVPIRTKILRVQASDADSGRNGELFFSIADSPNANSAFAIDSLSGEIYTTSSFDYESSTPKLHKLKVMASDNGEPRKSSFVFVYINIVDENDNCPVFDSSLKKHFNISQNTHPGTLLTVVSANDKDSGLNGKVIYNVLSASNPNGSFKVDQQNGELTTVNRLIQMEYRLFVVARDLGVPSCSRQIELTVNVFAEGKGFTTGFTTQEATSGITTEVSTEETTKKSETTLLTGPSTEGIPVSLDPQTESWYKKPSFIIGVSCGGFVVLIVILLAKMLLNRKKKRSASKHRKAMADVPDAVSGQYRDNEAYEMDNMRHLYF